MNIDKAEVLRYLGYRNKAADENTSILIDECISEIKAKSECRSTYRRFNLEVTEDETINIDRLSFRSHNLSRNLKDCSEVILFAATLGMEIDRSLAKYLKLDIAKAVVFQSTAAAAIEAYCDEQNERIIKLMAEEGLYVRPRYSPGYGDVSIDIQKDFLNLIASKSTVGITLSEGNIMIPEKSVSAFMGLSRINTLCHKAGCENCSKKDCDYKRN